jgi:hypothetical protein
VYTPAVSRGSMWRMRAWAVRELQPPRGLLTATHRRTYGIKFPVRYSRAVTAINPYTHGAPSGTENSIDWIVSSGNGFVTGV